MIRRILVLSLMAALFLTGCATTDIIDREYLGELLDRPPDIENRYALGLFLYPVAFSIDTATFPLQYIALMIGGDDLLYKWDKEQASAEIDFGPTSIPDTATTKEIGQIIANDINNLSTTDPYQRAKDINRIYTHTYFIPGTSTLRKFSDSQ